MKKKVCIVDDDPKIVYAFRMILENKGYEVVSCTNGKEIIDLLNDSIDFQVIFLDIAMPDISGLIVLKEIRHRNLNIPVVVITGFGTMDTAIKAIQLGAYEYITKPLDMKKILLLTQRSMEVGNMKKKITDLENVLMEQQEDGQEITGNSDVMQEIYKIIGSITSTSSLSPVLIEGESGTGKELVAKALHKNSDNRNEPFVVINCTTLPENLLESELFGYEKGAYTGATERKLGKIELAKKGTLFFDEIGDLRLNIQQKLLRLLEEREYERLGSNFIRKVESRFVFATNRKLEVEVSNGRFREDLWYRINVISIKIPPLRDRKDDIPLLVEYFLKRFNREIGKSITIIPDNVMKLLKDYDYPGNVRELRNLIERGMILSKDNVFRTEYLPDIFFYKDISPQIDFHIRNYNLKEARQEIIKAFEKKYLTELLKTHQGNVVHAAKTAGIKRQSLYRMFKKHKISIKHFKS